MIRAILSLPEERKKTMARKNITIPHTLKARMDRFPYVNWSKEATEAFQAHVNYHDLEMKKQMALFIKNFPWNQRRQAQTDGESKGGGFWGDGDDDY